MGLFARFWRYSVDTYGGAPLLLLINLVQIAILAWVVSQALRAQAERVAPGISSEARRIRRRCKHQHGGQHRDAHAPSAKKPGQIWGHNTQLAVPNELA